MDELWYELTGVNVKVYLGVKLETPPVTVVCKMTKKNVSKPDLEHSLDELKSNLQ